jgi:hypothetical protein
MILQRMWGPTVGPTLPQSRTRVFRPRTYPTSRPRPGHVPHAHPRTSLSERFSRKVAMTRFASRRRLLRGGLLRGGSPTPHVASPGLFLASTGLLGLPRWVHTPRTSSGPQDGSWEIRTSPGGAAASLGSLRRLPPMPGLHRSLWASDRAQGPHSLGLRLALSMGLGRAG